MNVDMRLLSTLQDCLPSGAEGGRATVALPDGATVADLVAHVGIDRRLRCKATEIVSMAGWQVLLNGREEPDMGRVLHEGDHIVILPQVFGG